MPMKEVQIANAYPVVFLQGFLELSVNGDKAPEGALQEVSSLISLGLRGPG